ncbi:MAG: class II aldolase/adducin family protein [Anaerolineae bacterium]
MSEENFYRERALREEIVQVCQHMYDKDLIAATDGNVSARWGEDHLLVTPSGVNKGLIGPQDVLLTDLKGRKVSTETMSPNEYEPSAELRLHLEIYRQRADVRAVVHGHPPITTALTVAGISLEPPVLPETLVTVGVIPTTDYATPSSSQGPVVVRELICEHDALALDRHGAVTVGATPLKAYFKLEKVENTAYVILMARLLGRLQTLPEEQVRHLTELRAEMLGPNAHFAAPDDDLCGLVQTFGPQSLDVEALADAVAERVLARLDQD